MARPERVLYTYKCAECGHRGEQRREWDGGVTLETPGTIADEAIARARERRWPDTGKRQRATPRPASWIAPCLSRLRCVACVCSGCRTTTTGY